MLYNTGNTCSGEYKIYIGPFRKPVKVYCDMNSATKKGCIVSETHLKMKSSTQFKNQLNQKYVFFSTKYLLFLWQVFQRRMYGSKDFNRNWSEYADGFGSVGDEHWLGENVFIKKIQMHVCRGPSAVAALYMLRAVAR